MIGTALSGQVLDERRRVEPATAASSTATFASSAAATASTDAAAAADAASAADGGPASPRLRQSQLPLELEYLCKFKGRAYIHSRWLSREEIIIDGRFSFQRLQHYEKKRAAGEVETQVSSHGLDEAQLGGWMRPNWEGG